MGKIILPNEIFGRPVKGAMERILAKDSQPIQQPQPRQGNMPDLNGFVYVPTTGLYVQKEKQLHGKNWAQTQEELGKQGMKPPTIEELRQFLIYLKQNPNPENTQIYNEITQVRNPWRSEWLDAKFEKSGKDMHIIYHAFDGNSIVEKNEKLSGHLTEDKLPGISLEKWLEDATVHGLPKSGIEEGQLYYWAPVSGYVAGFFALSGGADLACGGSPDGSCSGLGVRGVMREAPRDASRGGN